MTWRILLNLYVTSYLVQHNNAKEQSQAKSISPFTFATFFFCFFVLFVFLFASVKYMLNACGAIDWGCNTRARILNSWNKRRNDFTLKFYVWFSVIHNVSLYFSLALSVLIYFSLQFFYSWLCMALFTHSNRHSHLLARCSTHL